MLESSVRVLLLVVLSIGCGAQQRPGASQEIAPVSPSAPQETAPVNPLEGRYVSSFVSVKPEDLRELGGAKRAEFFAQLPLEAFVYANSELDEKLVTEIRGQQLEDRFPHKDEPLLMLYPKTDGRPVVTTADGVEVVVDWTRLSATPESRPLVLSAPRAVTRHPGVADIRASALAYPNTDSGWVSRTLRPLRLALFAEFPDEDWIQNGERILMLLRAAANAHDACRNRVMASFDKQVQAGTWTATEQQSGRAVSVKSPRALKAEEKAFAKSDKVCGDRAALQKKYVAIYDAEDASARARLASERARFYEQATARFRGVP